MGIRIEGSPKRRPKKPSWAAGLQQEIDRNRASLESAEIQTERDASIRNEIIDLLERAEFALRDFEQQNWLGRLVSAGAVYEDTLAKVHVASEDLLLIGDDALVQARLPDLRAGVKAYLGPGDPRFDEYTRLIDRLVADSSSMEKTDSSSLMKTDSSMEENDYSSMKEVD